jgi:hypothetical protein
MGVESINANTTGTNNVGIGVRALKSNTTFASNTAVGYEALRDNDAPRNSAFGKQCLPSSTTGINQTGFGDSALFSCTTGTLNSGFGRQALVFVTTGSCNTALGTDSLYGVTTGSGNLGLGALTAAEARSPVFVITTEDNRISMGSTAVTNAYVQVAWTVVSDARDKMNFASVPHGLNFVKQLNPIQYQFRESRESNVPHGPVRYGFKAQDIQALEGSSPVIIDAENSEKLRYNGESLVPVLVKAIQELSAKVDALQAELNQLKGA